MNQTEKLQGIIGESFHARRLEKGLTMRALAQRSNVCVAEICRIESGSSNITLHVLTSVCAGLEIALDKFIEGALQRARDDKA